MSFLNRLFKSVTHERVLRKDIAVGGINSIIKSYHKSDPSNNYKNLFTTNCFRDHKAMTKTQTVMQNHRRRVQSSSFKAQRREDASKCISSSIIHNNHRIYAKEDHRNPEPAIDKEYEKCVEQLNTLQSNAESLKRSASGAVKQNGLTDTVKFLERSGLSLDALDEKLSFIHVAGTKGKGSTCALTESIIRAHGFKTGFFSSPHLVSVTERIRIDGRMIDKSVFVSNFKRVFNRLRHTQDHENDMPAYFKFLTILSFHIFIEQKVDVVILEVGIGGELDCTNIIRKPKVVGITSLGLEHTQILGNTLKEIAWQKAGIIKSSSNVFTSASQAECLEVISQRAKDKNVQVFQVPEYKEYFTKETEILLSKQNNIVHLNGSLAIQLACEWLRLQNNKFVQEYPVNGTNITKDIMEGIMNCNWPGRCQTIRLPNINVHLDGAHTIESMTVCGDWFADTVAGSPRRKVLIFNTTGDRDSKKLLEILRQKNRFDLACFVPNVVSVSGNRNDILSVTSVPEQIKRARQHGRTWISLCQEAGECDSKSASFDSISKCLSHINNRFGNSPLEILVTGSIHLIGATIVAFNEYYENLNMDLET